MKKARKVVALTLCAVLLVVGSVAGTMAYLTSTTETVTNTFTVGQVNITLDEAKVDEDGVAVTPAERITANTYKLLPGHTYIKDPIIHVTTGSEDCWLFVKVDNGIAGIEAETGEDGYTDIADQMEANGWSAVDGAENVYAYSSIVAGDADVDVDVDVFENFKIKGELTNDALADYEGETITVTAYAVQADGFANAGAAWEAAPADWEQTSNEGNGE